MQMNRESVNHGRSDDQHAGDIMWAVLLKRSGKLRNGLKNAEIVRAHMELASAK